MKKQTFLGFLAIVAVFVLCGCSKTLQSKYSNKEIAFHPGQEIPKPSFMLTDSLLPKWVDLKQDISKMSFQELRLLRHYPYALHKMWFMDGEINNFYRNRTNWYFNMFYEDCDQLYYLSYDEVELSPEEQAFVKKIDKRMEKILKDMGWKNGEEKPEALTTTVNLFQLDNPESDFFDMMQKYHIAIVPTKCEQLFNIYEENDYLMMPNFITTDVYLQAYHIYFSYVLKSLERYTFIPKLRSSVNVMNGVALRTALETKDKALKERAEFASTFFAIAEHLLTDSVVAYPSSCATDFKTECENIMSYEDAPSEFLRFTQVNFPYSMFKPRGHYTRNKLSERYFRTMMWLQTAVFCKDDDVALRNVIFIAQLLNSIPEKERANFTNVYDALTFLMGEPDNLSIKDVADYLKSKGHTGLTASSDDAIVDEVNAMLTEMAKKRNRIAPKIQISCKDKINLMPQRYMADNEVLGEMVDVTVNSEKAYPKGIEVFSAFGVESADAILDTCYDEADKWHKYEESLAKMKKQFAHRTDWDNTMYDKWVECLVELQHADKSYPQFMQTSAWECKNLNTALASWTTLKHDAILYGEQPIAAECGDCGPPEPIVRGYIEPNIKFWRKLHELIVLNRTMLEHNDLMTEDLRAKTEQLEEKVKFCIGVVEKELSGTAVTDEEFYTIRYMGSSLEWFTLSVLDPDLMLDSWDLVQGADRSVAVVADVYTRNVPGCKKNGILHEGTGNANAIYVMVNINGNCYITRGATYSYYEFVRPLGERLTDEEWQKMLDEGKAPAYPKWIDGLMLKKQPEINEMLFYSSGC